MFFSVKYMQKCFAELRLSWTIGHMLIYTYPPKKCLCIRTDDFFIIILISMQMLYIELSKKGRDLRK